MTDPREPELPFDDDMAPKEFTGPRDQVGFYDLKGDRPQPLRDDVSPEPDVPEDGEEPDEDRMGILDHLDELRTVLIHSSYAALAATILCWFWSADLLDLLIKPIESEGVYFTAPNEAFLTRLKLSAVVGMFVVAPFIFFKFYSFVMPGLYKKERKVVTPLLLATTLLFYLGIAFAFMVVIPQVVTFLLSFGTDNLSPLIGVGPYFGFVSRLCLAFGLVFELPLLVLFFEPAGHREPPRFAATLALCGGGHCGPFGGFDPARRHQSAYDGRPGDAALYRLGAGFDRCDPQPETGRRGEKRFRRPIRTGMNIDMPDL